MQDIRVVALDLDGTVFDDAKTISPRNAAAINAALQKGVLVLPATGRPATGVPQQFLDWPGVDYAITSNGATVTELATGKKLVEQPISPALAIQLYDLLQPFGGLISVFVDGQSYSQTGNVDACDAFLPPNLRAYFHTTRGEAEDLRQFMRDHAQEIEKFSIIYPDDAARDAAWLEQNGYRAEKVQPVDLFPRTKHCEAVLLLTKLDVSMEELDVTAAENKAT